MRLIWGAYALRSMRTNSGLVASPYFRMFASFSIFAPLSLSTDRTFTTKM